MTVHPSELSTGWFGKYQIVKGTNYLGTGQCLDLTPNDLTFWNPMAGDIQQDLVLGL